MHAAAGSSPPRVECRIAIKTRSSRLAGAALAIGLVDALLYLFAPDRLAGPGRLAAKCLPALCLAVWAARGRARTYAGLVAAGLVCSALGDGLLNLGGSMFLAGMLAFLCAHLLYVVAFARRTRSPAPLAAVPFAAWGVGAYALVLPRLGGMAAPVAAYVAVISAMMWRAAALSLDEGAPARVRSAALAGAISFGLSDTLIAFGKWSGPVHAGGVTIMVLYWAGQFGIAASAAWMPASEPAAP